MDLKNTATVIEYGAAAGVITKRLLPKLPAHGRLLAVERNPAFAAALRARARSRIRGRSSGRTAICQPPSTISVGELTHAGKLLLDRSAAPYETFFMIALLYLVMAALVLGAMRLLALRFPVRT